MVSRYSVVFGILLLASVPCWSDQVTLTNGDRITGAIQKSDDKTLTLKTELAGTVEIKWSGIKDLTSDQKLAITTSATSQPYSGTVSAKDGNVTITSAAGETHTV